MITYSEWLLQQTPERQHASLEIMQVCIRLGEVQRTSPSSDECKTLTAQIVAYNASVGVNDGRPA